MTDEDGSREIGKDGGMEGWTDEDERREGLKD